MAFHLKSFISTATVILLISLLNGCSSGTFDTPAEFAGSTTCIECHEIEYDLWKGSDHDNAMDTAIESTVLGDFDEVIFKHNNFEHKFYRKNGRYYVYTLGPEGKPREFQIDYTFGIRPLQQYLVPFENGRYQVLPITWDTERNVWYHMVDSVYQGEPIKPDDWLYWTNNGQNWNGMCAECHSTNLRKNFNPETHVYTTSWSEIDVSCEACHGPGSNHNTWAEMSAFKQKRYENYGLTVQTSNITSRELVDQCAFCHSRRTSFADFVHPRDNLFDIISPHLPVPPYYYIDGQILEEDYVYASFTQSKMHQNNVRCSNCHDSHSLNLKFDGNKLCQQCHKKETYDTYDHHFHKNFNEDGEPLVLQNGNKTVAVGEGSLCVSCHMPGRYFMGVDYRRDHSMRIPRPDLSDELGTPNACTQCHTDQTNVWAASYTTKWYENPKRFHFGETMHLANQGDTAAIKMLIDLLESDLSSPLIRASASSFLLNFPENERTKSIYRNLLTDKDALVRREAVRLFNPVSLDDLVQSLSPLLSDANQMIRIEVAARLSAVPIENLDTVQKRLLDIAVNEYIASNSYTADFASSRHNLGNMYSNLGQNQEAIKQYKEALKIDDAFYPAKVNLAMLYNQTGNNDDAESLFREAIKDQPENGNLYYSMGLLLAEKKNYKEATSYLKSASLLIPENPRVFYNLGLLQNYLGDTKEAEISLLKASELAPMTLDIQVALIDFYLKSQQFDKAKPLVMKYKQTFPEDESIDQLIEFIEGKVGEN